MRFAVNTIVDGTQRWQCLKEMIESVVWGLKQRGHEVAFNVDPSSVERTIFFNAHQLHPSIELPANGIIYNAEQVAWVEASNQKVYLDRLKRHVVWDYSQVNADRLRALGARVALCEVGHWPKMTRIEPAAEDVDVLFYGSIDARRREILVGLVQAGLKVKALFDVYAEQRDEWIARSKIVLNTHFRDPAVWEIFRCSYLLANGKCVVSESGGADEALEALAAETTAYVSRKKIVETCARLAGDAEERKSISEKGREIFCKRDQAEFVRRALAETEKFE